ncbi:MAG: hypothetical protein WCJ66_09500, partial [Verrucomicrobiota bacterium]
YGSLQNQGLQPHDKKLGLAAGRIRNFAEKMQQLGSYGGGNHFGECEITRVIDRPSARETAAVFGLLDKHAVSHCYFPVYWIHSSVLFQKEVPTTRWPRRLNSLSMCSC